MNNATIALIDAAFEMSAATKREYPKEGTPEFFALTDVAHRLECACIAYKKSLAQRPLKSGSVREAGRLDPDLAMKVRLCASDAEGQTLLAQAFEGFEKIDLVSANKFLRSLAEKEDAGLSIVGAYGAVTERLHAVQADNAKLREVLEKINRKSSHDFDDDSIYTLSKSVLQSFRAAEEKL